MTTEHFSQGDMERAEQQRDEARVQRDSALAQLVKAKQCVSDSLEKRRAMKNQLQALHESFLQLQTDLADARAEIERVKKAADDLSERAMAVAFDKVDLTEALSAIQRENEALLKTVMQREEHLWDIATISAQYKL